MPYRDAPRKATDARTVSHLRSVSVRDPVQAGRTATGVAVAASVTSSGGGRDDVVCSGSGPTNTVRSSATPPAPDPPTRTVGPRGQRRSARPARARTTSGEDAGARRRGTPPPRPRLTSALERAGPQLGLGRVAPRPCSAPVVRASSALRAATSAIAGDDVVGQPAGRRAARSRSAGRGSGTRAYAAHRARPATTAASRSAVGVR